MLVGYQNGGFLKRTLAESGTRWNIPKPAFLHRHVAAAGEYVDDIRIDESAVIVSYVDDASVFALIFRVEIDVKLIQRPLAHIRQMNISDPAAADLSNIGSVVIHPLTIKQVLLSSGRDRPNDGFALA